MSELFERGVAVHVASVIMAHRDPDQPERDKTADAQTAKVGPQPFRLRQEIRHAHARSREHWAMLAAGACAGIALMAAIRRVRAPLTGH